MGEGGMDHIAIRNNVAPKSLDGISNGLSALETVKKKKKPKTKSAANATKKATGPIVVSSVPPSLPPTLPPLPPTIPIARATDFEFHGSSEGFAATKDDAKSQYEEGNIGADGDDVSYLMNGSNRLREKAALSPEQLLMEKGDKTAGELTALWNQLSLEQQESGSLSRLRDVKGDGRKLLSDLIEDIDDRIKKGEITEEGKLAEIQSNIDIIEVYCEKAKTLMEKVVEPDVIKIEPEKKEEAYDMEVLAGKLEEARLNYARMDHEKRSAWDKIRSFFGKKDDKEKNAELLKQAATETDPIKKAELQAQFLEARKNKDADVEYMEAHYLNNLRDYKAGMLSGIDKQGLKDVELDVALGDVAETLVLERDTLASTQNDIKESSLMESYPGKAWGYWLKSAEAYKGLPTKKKLMVAAALFAGGWAAGGVGVTAAALAGGGTLLRLLGATGLGAGVAAINKGNLERRDKYERSVAGKTEVGAMLNSAEQISDVEKIAEFDKKLNDCVFQADEKLRDMQRKSSRMTVEAVSSGIAAGTLMYNVMKVADFFGVTDKVHDLIDWAGDKTQALYEGVTNKAQDLYAGISDKTQDLYDGVSDKAHSLLGGGSEGAHSMSDAAAEHVQDLPKLGESVLEVHKGSNFIDTLEKGYLAEHRAEFIKAHPEFSGHTNEHIAFELAERYTETHPDMEGHLPDLIHEGAKLHFNPANLQIEIDDPQGHSWYEPTPEATPTANAASGDVSESDLQKGLTSENVDKAPSNVENIDQATPDNAETVQKVEALDAKVEEHLSKSVPENSEHDFKTWEKENDVKKAIMELDEQHRNATGELFGANDVETQKIYDRMDNIKSLKNEAIRVADQLHADHVVGADATEIGSLLEKGASSGRILEAYLDKLTEASPNKVAFWNEIKNQPFGEVKFGDNIKGVSQTISDFQQFVGEDYADQIYPKTDLNGNQTEKTGDWLVRIKNLALKLRK